MRRWPPPKPPHVKDVLLLNATELFKWAKNMGQNFFFLCFVAAIEILMGLMLHRRLDRQYRMVS